ncbi:MAG TPA: sigma-70 family RNA polymerase sigma factor [Dehalococcoidia bacterium]|nr:sigma-70 family RNA polymerase sigma factor [Dehalococcoidia bacterium]
MALIPSFDNEVSRVEPPSFPAVSLELEREAVNRARAGEQQALADLYDWYMPRVYRYALARVGNVAEAEDITEEVFLKMLGAIADFRWKDVPFSSWLFRIAHNHVATYFRRNAQRGGPAAALTEDMVDGRHDLAASVEERITLEEVQRATEQLPDAQREVIALRFAVGLSISETAKVLGKRENNIKALQHKAVARLQRLLVPEASRLDAGAK